MLTEGPVTCGLLTLDLSWARAFAPGNSDADLLVAMHRARYDRPELPIEARRESATWLMDRGLADLYGLPVAMPWSVVSSREHPC